MTKILRLCVSFSVMLVSVGLLIFIGVGESYRVIPSLTLNQICKQVQMVSKDIEYNLKLGLPMEYPGFSVRLYQFALNHPQIEQATLSKINPLNNEKHQGADLYSHDLRCSMPEKQLLEHIHFNLSGLLKEINHINQYHLVYPVGNTPEALIDITLTAGLFSRPILLQFRPVTRLVAIFMLICPVLLLMQEKLSMAKRVRFKKWLHHCMFLLVTTIVTFQYISLYQDQLKSSSVTLADAIESRLSSPLKMGFDLTSNFSGLNQLLNDYAANNPDISYLYISKQGKIVFSPKQASQPEVILSSCAPAPHKSSVRVCRRLADSDYVLIIETPWSVIYQKVIRVARNILVLFLASLLLANLFIGGMLPSESISRRYIRYLSSPSGATQIQVEQSVYHLLPLFVLGVLTESISLSFISSYLAQTLAGSPYTASMAFCVYYICFAAMLIPAGRWAEKHSLRHMLILSLFIATLTQSGLATTTNPHILILCRALSGATQSVFFIAVQSYLLTASSHLPQLKSGEKILSGFNISTISGMTIGALLAYTLGEKHVFMFGGFLGMIAFVSCVICIRDIQPGQPAHLSVAEKASNLALQEHKSPKTFLTLLKDIDIYKSVMLVGFPAKALYVGIIVFLLPILLASQQFQPDLIGQILVCYYLGSMAATVLQRRYPQLTESHHRIIWLGCLGSGVALVIIGLGSLNDPFLTHFNGYLSRESCNALRFSCGVFLLGLSQGLIQSAVIPQVLNTKSARLLGKNTLSAAYRFLERLGHISGPSLAAFFLISNGGIEPPRIMLLGVYIAFSGSIFFILSHQAKGAQPS